MEQKGSFPYSQQPTIRPYIVSDESNLYKMHIHTMLQAPKQSLPVRFHYYVIPYSTVLSEKLTVPQPVKKLPPFYGTRRFITALTSARHLSLCWGRARFMTEIWIFQRCYFNYMTIQSYIKVQADSRRLHTTKAQVQCPTSPSKFCGGQWHCDKVFLPALPFSSVSTIPPTFHTHSFTYHPRYIMFLSQHFSFPLSVPFHHCSIHIHSPTNHTK